MCAHGPEPDDALVARALDTASRRSGRRGPDRRRRRHGDVRLRGRHRHVVARRRRAHAWACSCSSNFGLTERFVLCGRPVGRELASETASSGEGSCICLVATDAPLLPHQLRRLARRPFLGLGAHRLLRLARLGRDRVRLDDGESPGARRAGRRARAADAARRPPQPALRGLRRGRGGGRAERALRRTRAARIRRQGAPPLPRGALRGWRDSRRAPGIATLARCALR